MSVYHCPYCQVKITDPSLLLRAPCPHCGEMLDGSSAARALVESLWGESLSETNPSQQATIRSKCWSSSGSQPILRRLPVSDLHHPAGVGDAYALQVVLGEGGMGTVYQASQTSLDRQVALKRIRSDIRSDKRARDKFLAEALVTGGLEHPNIPPVYEIGEDGDGLPFYAMKQVHGVPWSERISMYSLTQNIEVLVTLGNALAFAHSRQIIHRDLKPSNVMLGEFGEILVMDWGLALSLDGSRGEGLSDKTSIGGTPAYMPPEVAQGRNDKIGLHSDIYLMGALLFEIITGKPPHAGDNTLDCLAKAVQNMIQPTQVRSNLLAIAYKAMATDVTVRYPDVAGFQQALRDFLAHCESDQLRDQAEAELTEAEFGVTYEGYLRAQAKFQQAVELWPNNVAAREGLIRCNLAYADCAYRRGDFDLAWQLLDREEPSHQKLWTDIHRAVVARGRRRPGGWSRLLLVGLGLLVGILVTWFLVAPASGKGAWLTVYSQIWDHPSVTDRLLFFADSFDQRVSPPMVQADGLVLQDGLSVWLEGLDTSIDLRVDLTVQWPEEVDGLEIIMAGERSLGTTGWNLVPVGYSCHFAGWHGLLHQIGINRQIQAPNPGSGIASLLQPGQQYVLSLERRGQRVRMLVDGKSVLERLDLLAHRMPPIQQLGFRSWGECRIISCTVQRRSPEPGHQPLAGANSLRDHGHYADAYRLYRSQARDLLGTSAGFETLVQSYILGLELPELVTPEVGGLLLERIAQHPRGQELVPALIALRTEHLWADGRWAAALDLLPEHVRHRPDSRLALDLLGSRPRRLPADLSERLLAWVARCERVHYLDLAQMDLNNIDWVANMPLRSLVCNGNALERLPSLAATRLVALNCSDNPLSELPELPASLRQLQADRCRLRHLQQLAGTNLRRLVVNNNAIADVGPLIGLPLLEVDIGGNRIADITALRGMLLQRLDISDNQVEYLDVLFGSPLRRLRASDNRIVSIDPLVDLPLEELILDGNPIGEVRGLRGIPLRLLDVSWTQVVDLSPISGSKLQVLTLAGTPVAELNRLVAPDLRELDVSQTGLNHLPIGNMPRLELLNCRDAAIANLEEVASSKLQQLFCHRSDLSDQDYERLVHVAPPDLERSIMDEWRLARALAARWSELLTDSERYQGARYVFLPTRATRKACLALAQQAGGRLLEITDPEQEAWVVGLLRRHGSHGCWLGLEGDWPEHWLSGAPFTYRNLSMAQTHGSGSWHLFTIGSRVLWARAPDEQGASDLIIEIPVE